MRTEIRSPFPPCACLSSGWLLGFELLEDPLAERVEIVAKALGLEKVGWMFSHPPREEEGFRFTSAEILMSAQFQLEAGGHGSPFVTVTGELSFPLLFISISRT